MSDAHMDAPVGAPKKPTAKPVEAPPAEADRVDGLVKARFVDVQAVFSPTQGVICYGDEFMVTAEQLEHDPRFIAWAESWVPDPALLAASKLEG